MLYFADTIGYKVKLMLTSIVRNKLSLGKPVVCAKVCYGDPEIVEMVGHAGFDCVWICLEHRQLDPSVVKALILSCRTSGCDCLLRVKPQDHTSLAFLIESGARGIMVPHVRDLEEVLRVVDMMKFPPLGRRGLDPIHVDSDFGQASLASYVRHENENTFLAIQIETPEVLPDIEVIAAVPGVDILFVGLADLSANLGLLGQMDHPKLQEIVKRIGKACMRHGKAGAINCSDPMECERLRGVGYRFFNVASDFRFIRKGFDAAMEESRSWVVDL